MKYYYCCLCSLILFSYGCNLAKDNSGASISIEDSKKRGVFVAEVLPLINPVRIGDSILIDVNSGWVENSWKYGESSSKSIVLDSSSYQIILLINQEMLINYKKNWMIGVEINHNFRNADKSAIISNYKGNLPDTLFYPIQNGRNVFKVDKGKIIGDFALKLIK